MALFGLLGRSARSRKSRIARACLPVVEGLTHRDGSPQPASPVEPHGCGAIVEELEHKVHLTFTAGVSAPSTYTYFQTYTLNLFTTGGTAKQWVVYWNDPNDTSPSQTYTDSTGFTNPVSESHTYTTQPPSGPIYAVATAMTNATATAYLGLYSSFGSSSSTGKSLFSPAGGPYSSATTPVVSAIDENTDATQGYVYSATDYRPTSGSHNEFVVTRTTNVGTVDTTWGPNHDGELAFNFDSNGDDIPSSIIVSKTGGYVVVAGKDATGWALAIINTSTQLVNYKTTSNFHSGQVNALGYDISDDEVAVAGDDGSGNMAAGLLAPTLSNGAYSPNWQWGGSIKTYSVTGYSASATSVVPDVGNQNTGTESENAMVIAGDSVYNSGLDSDFTMIAINKSDGSTLNTFGTNGVIHTFNIGCHLLNPASYDSETSLVSWYNGSYYLTEVGYSGCNISLVRYLCSVSNGNLTNASLDTSFGQYNGLALGPTGTANAAVQDPVTGTIYTAGADAANSDFLIAAIDDTGAAASTFANDGIMQIDMGSSSGDVNNSTDVADSIQFDSDTANGVVSLVVSGTSNSTHGDMALADILPSSTPTRHA